MKIRKAIRKQIRLSLAKERRILEDPMCSLWLFTPKNNQTIKYQLKILCLSWKHHLRKGGFMHGLSIENKKSLKCRYDAFMKKPGITG